MNTTTVSDLWVNSDFEKAHFGGLTISDAKLNALDKIDNSKLCQLLPNTTT